MRPFFCVQGGPAIKISEMSESDAISENLRPLRTRLSFNIKARFPNKLFQVVNDDFILKWDYDGTSIFVEEKDFEEKVLKCYPGFVQIASFLNVRRLFREYSFDWRIVDGTESLFQFSHPAFIRGRADLLPRVKTKRRSFIGKFSSRGLFSQTTRTAKRLHKQHCRSPAGMERNEAHLCRDTFGGFQSAAGADCSSSLPSATCSSAETLQDAPCYENRADQFSGALHSCLHPSYSHVPHSMDQCDSPPNKQDLFNILALYAQNELTPEEHLQLLANTAAEEEQFFPKADSRRESILSHTLTSAECVPFDYSVPSTSFEQWWERRTDNAPFLDMASDDMASDQSIYYNISAISLMPEFTDITPDLPPITDVNATSDSHFQTLTHEGLAVDLPQAGAEKEMTEADPDTTTLWELKPVFFDQTNITDDTDHTQAQF